MLDQADQKRLDALSECFRIGHIAAAAADALTKRQNYFPFAPEDHDAIREAISALKGMGGTAEQERVLESVFAGQNVDDRALSELRVFFGRKLVLAILSIEQAIKH